MKTFRLQPHDSENMFKHVKTCSSTTFDCVVCLFCLAFDEVLNTNSRVRSHLDLSGVNDSKDMISEVLSKYNHNFPKL